jgi:hypothetical protein
MGKVAVSTKGRTQVSISNQPPMVPQPTSGTWGWKCTSDSGEARVRYDKNTQVQSRTYYADNSYIGWQAVGVLKSGGNSGYVEESGKGSGVNGVQINKKPPARPTIVPNNAIPVKFDQKYGQIVTPPIAPSAPVAPVAPVTPGPSEPVETPSTIPDVGDVNPSDGSFYTTAQVAGLQAGLDPSYNPLGQGTLISQLGGAWAAGYTPLLQPQKITVSQGGGGRYEQGQVSTSIYYEDEHNGHPITERSEKGGVPVKMYWKDQVLFEPDQKLQFEQISNRQTPSRPLSLYDALPLGTEYQAVQPFRFKDVRLRRRVPQLNRDNPPIDQELPNPAVPAQPTTPGAPVYVQPEPSNVTATSTS